MRPEPFWLEVGPFCLVPVVHYRMEFALEVRRVFEAVKPARVAVELAPFLLDPWLEGVGRFPRLTTLTYTLQGHTFLLPLEPTDAFCEAARSALEGKLPVHAIDLPMLYTATHQDRVPDSSSLTAIGLKAYWEQWCAHVPQQSHPEDDLREAHMANTLLMLSRLHPEEKILVVVGMAHLRPLLAYLESQDVPLRLPPDFRAPQVELSEPAAHFVRGFSQEMAYLMTCYELQRGGPGPEETWKSPPEPPEEAPDEPRRRLQEMKPEDLMASLHAMLAPQHFKPPPLTSEQKRALNRYLRGLSQQPLAFHDLLSQLSGPPAPEKTLKLPSVTPPPRVRAFTFKQAADRRGELLERYQQSVALGLDRQLLIMSMLEQAADFYHQNTGTHILPWQTQVLFQFVRNVARLQDRLLPNLYELMTSARGAADDNYSYEVWDLGGFYPWAPEDQSQSKLPLLDLDADTLTLAGQKVKEWRFHRKLPRLRSRLPIKDRAREGADEDWSESFENGSLCSYPPEDLVIEDYARYLQKKAIQQLSSEKARVEPFSTSLLDGIDMRETLRNWHERKIFVRESRRVQGGVGAVVLIFDEDEKDQRYPWRMTWHGEHSQESDMSFYATPIQAKIVGPGIARCEYGGILMTYPNRRLADCWSDAFYSHCRGKSEILLMAGLEYGLDVHLVYVAAKPPRSQFRTLAARLGKKIVYMPIGNLSPQSIERIRVFHVLSSHQRRKFAEDFIW
jgi:hypothetical protein